MKEVIHKFEIVYGIPDSSLKEAKPFIDMIQKGVEGLKPFAKDINVGTSKEEKCTIATYHKCNHELGLPCTIESVVAIDKLDAVTMTSKIVEPIKEGIKDSK